MVVSWVCLLYDLFLLLFSFRGLFNTLCGKLFKPLYHSICNFVILVCNSTFKTTSYLKSSNFFSILDSSFTFWWLLRFHITSGDLRYVCCSPLLGRHKERILLLVVNTIDLTNFADIRGRVTRTRKSFVASFIRHIAHDLFFCNASFLELQGCIHFLKLTADCLKFRT